MRLIVCTLMVDFVLGIVCRLCSVSGFVVVVLFCGFVCFDAFVVFW